MPINKLFFLLFFLVCELSYAGTARIGIQDFTFSQETVTVNIGDTVKWVNNDAFAHTTTSSTNPSGTWNSNLNQGQSFSYTFNKEGTYDYVCTLHPFMRAKVVVRTPEQMRISIGKNILNKTIPLTLNLSGKNADLVYLGSYIVNTQTGCANCHSCPTYKPGNNPYLGQPKVFNTANYLAGGVKVTGGQATAISSNLTPDVTGKPGGLTFAAFSRILKVGHDPEAPGSLVPVMPWPIFGMMSNYDITAIYEYLRAIPHAEPSTFCAAPGQ